MLQLVGNGSITIISIHSVVIGGLGVFTIIIVVVVIHVLARLVTGNPGAVQRVIPAVVATAVIKCTAVLSQPQRARLDNNSVDNTILLKTIM